MCRGPVGARGLFTLQQMLVRRVNGIVEAVSDTSTAANTPTAKFSGKLRHLVRDETDPTEAPAGSIGEPALSPEQVGKSVFEIATFDHPVHHANTLTSGGISPLPERAKPKGRTSQ